MLSKKLEKALNDQINAEFYSSYFYLNMAIYCDENDLPGFAHWLYLQTQEEYDHAMKMLNYVQDRDGKAVLDKIEKPEGGFKDVLDVFEKVAAHEKKVTGLINNLYGLAAQENDYPTQVMLQWFISEQVEEEKTAKDIVQQIRWVGKDTSALYMLDQKMSQRTLTGGGSGGDGAQ